MVYDILYHNYDFRNNINFNRRGKYMKDNSINWSKASVWIAIILFCIMFWYGLIYMDLVNEFIGFIFLCGMGYFAYMSSVIVSEEKTSRKKND